MYEALQGGEWRGEFYAWVVAGGVPTAHVGADHVAEGADGGWLDEGVI